MAGLAQKRAVARYRQKITKQGLARFEVIAPARDKDLIRDLARRLAAEGPEAAQLRETLAPAPPPGESSGGRLWDMLRNSPLVGADLDFSRPVVRPRPLKL